MSTATGRTVPGPRGFKTSSAAGQRFGDCGDAAGPLLLMNLHGHTEDATGCHWALSGLSRRRHRCGGSWAHLQHLTGLCM